jgi:hypothetical protein
MDDQVNLNIPRIERSQAVKTTLSEEKRAALFEVVQMRGYGVILELMQACCILQDATLVNVEPGLEKKIVAEHGITVAKWEMFDWIQKQVEKEVHTHLNPAPTETRTQEQIVAAETLNP